MYWGPLQRFTSYVRSSLWTVPLLAIPVAMIAVRLVHSLDGWGEWTLLGFGVSGAQAMLQAATTAILSFLVFTFGSLLVAIPGRERAADAPDHRHDPAAGQRRPLHRRAVHVHVHLRAGRCG
jgi:hypothetical protein